MKRPTNRAIGLYLIWILIHFTILFTNNQCRYAREIFYPFTSSEYRYSTFKYNFVLDAYDITEFIFYNVAVIFLYFIYYLLGINNFFSKSNDKESRPSVESHNKNGIIKKMLLNHIDKTNNADWSTQLSFVKYVLIWIILLVMEQIIKNINTFSFGFSEFDIVETMYKLFFLLLYSHFLFLIFLMLRFLVLKLIFIKGSQGKKIRFWMPIPYINLLVIMIVSTVIIEYLD
jgi:hypothetical protein